jgi:hypothetical protein
MMQIVPYDGMNAEAIQAKYPIIDWEIYTDEFGKCWKIIRCENRSEVYKHFQDIMKAFEREDLVKLWSLVTQRFKLTEIADDKEKMLWVELNRLFEPDKDDKLWKFNADEASLKWILYDTCGVHHVSTKAGTDIYMLVEKEYLLPTHFLSVMLSVKLTVEEDT